MLAPWEEQLAAHGKLLVTERDACVRELSGIAASLYSRIVEEEPLELVYKPDIADPDVIARMLREARSGDLQRKTTGRGPHRDDMEIRIAGREARNYGSQGQQKSAALVLKLAEVEFTLRRMGEYPVVLLDEALAELDSGRASRLFSAIPAEAQAVITTAHPEQLPEFNREDVHHFHIEGGRLEKK